MKKIVLLLVTLNLLQNICIAQKEGQALIDSLLAELPKAKEDTNKVNLLNVLSNKTGALGDFDKSLEYGNHALLLSQKINYKKGEANAYYYIGYTNHDRGNYTIAMKNYLASLKLAEEIGYVSCVCDVYNNLGSFFYDQGNYPEALRYGIMALKKATEINYKTGIRHSYNNLGINYEHQGNYTEALKYDFLDLKMSEEMGDKQGMGETFMNIGNVYMFQNDFSSALKNYEASLKNAEETGNDYGAAAATVSIGIVYREQGNYSGALSNYNKALTVFEKMEDKNAISTVYTDIAITFDLQRNYNKALEYYFKSMKLQEEQADSAGVSGSLIDIGSILTKQKKTKEAEIYFAKGLTIAKKYEIKNYIKNAYKGLTLLDSSTGNWKEAFVNHKLFINYRDKMFNETSTKKLVETQMLYEFDKKEAVTKAEHDKTEALSKEELQRQKLVRNSFIGGFALMILLAGVSYRSYRRKKKDNIIIIGQKKEVELQKHIVEEKNIEITQSIQYALRIQTAILPPQKIVKQYLENSFILYKPKDIVAGDFYWMETVEFTDETMKRYTDEGHPHIGTSAHQIILFAACDCTGHGVPGAMVSVVCHNALNRAVREFGLTEPAKILDKTAEIVIENFSKSEENIKDGMDISLCSYNPKTKTIQWAGANNPLWLLQNGELLETKADKQPIGMNDNRKPFTNHIFTLNVGDSVYLFTDGFADQFGGETGQKKLTRKRFKDLILSVQEKTLLEQGIALDKFITEYRKELEQIDDILVMGVRI